MLPVPSGGVASAPQTGNRYAYALSNPLRYSDPSGHFVNKVIHDPSLLLGAAAFIPGPVGLAALGMLGAIAGITALTGPDPLTGQQVEGPARFVGLALFAVPIFGSVIGSAAEAWSEVGALGRSATETEAALADGVRLSEASAGEAESGLGRLGGIRERLSSDFQQARATAGEFFSGSRFAQQGSIRLGRTGPDLATIGRDARVVGSETATERVVSERSLKDLANQIRTSGLHPASINQRTIGVGVDNEGALFAGSSNGFDPGQRATLDRLGITRVPGSQALHAEEELLRGVADVQRVGTSVRAPCGPFEHDCSC